MKITKRMKMQARQAVRASGVSAGRSVTKKEWSRGAMRVRKTITYSFEEGSLVSIKPGMLTGIIIGRHANHKEYFEVLAMDGRVLNVPGFRLRKAD